MPCHLARHERQQVAVACCAMNTGWPRIGVCLPSFAGAAGERRLATKSAACVKITGSPRASRYASSAVPSRNLERKRERRRLAKIIFKSRMWQLNSGDYKLADEPSACRERRVRRLIGHAFKRNLAPNSTDEKKGRSKTTSPLSLRRGCLKGRGPFTLHLPFDNCEARHLDCKKCNSQRVRDRQTNKMSEVSLYQLRKTDIRKEEWSAAASGGAPLLSRSTDP